MIGDGLCRLAVNILGFVWPAYQTFKALSQKKSDEIRSWCTYWVVLALFTVLERIVLDRLLFWVPLYYELKVGIVLYLWHPKTKGAVNIYDHLLEPLLVKHEPQIDKTLSEASGHIVEFSSKHFKSAVTFVQSKAQMAVGQLKQMQEKAK